jgi:hypothetical protein
LSSNITKLRNLMPWLSYVFTICHMKRGFDPMNFLRLCNLTHEVVDAMTVLWVSL